MRCKMLKFAKQKKKKIYLKKDLLMAISHVMNIIL